jgi:hypothetical protein
MQNLDEKIDSLLYGSLLEQDKKLSRTVIRHDRAAKTLRGHLNVDRRVDGLRIDDLKYLISFFVEDHQDEAKKAGRVLTLKEEDNPKTYLINQTIRTKILNDLRNRRKKSIANNESFNLARLQNYLDPYRMSGGAKISDYDTAVYNFKRLIWAAKQMGFYKNYNIGDFDPRPESSDEQPQPEPEKTPDTEPEKTPDTEPEKAPEAGEQKPEEPKQELSPQEQKEVQDYMNKSIHLLAIQAILDGEYQPPAKYGRLIRKYFIEKEVRRKGTLAEDLFEQEEEKPKQTPKTSNTDDEQQKDDLRMVRQALFEKRPPTPKEAKESYESLLQAFKLKSNNPGEEMMRRVPEESSDFKSRLGRIKFLIYRGAGVEVEEARKMSKINPFDNSLNEDAVRTPVLNLNDFKGNSLNEGMLGMFGAWIEYALKGMFGGWGSNLKVLGSKRDVEAFAKTLSGEARYIQAAKKYGLDHPTTYRNKSSLEVAVKNFEKETGIQWPFR